MQDKINGLAKFGYTHFLVVFWDLLSEEGEVHEVLGIDTFPNSLGHSLALVPEIILKPVGRPYRIRNIYENCLLFKCRSRMHGATKDVLHRLYKFYSPPVRQPPRHQKLLSEPCHAFGIGQGLSKWLGFTVLAAAMQLRPRRGTLGKNIWRYMKICGILGNIWDNTWSHKGWYKIV